MAIFLINILIGEMVPFFLLYGRKKKWATERMRWRLTGGLLVIGIAALLFWGLAAVEQGFQFLLIPFIYNCVDRWFKYLSIKKYGRDFYLYLRFSGEIDDRLFADNPHVKLLDKFFSIFLLFFIMSLTVGGILLYRVYKYGAL